MMYINFFKRFIDIFISLLILPIIFIIGFIIFIFIKIEDQGTLFYKSLRLGKNGRTFKMIKFRSMKENAAVKKNLDGSTFVGENDSRLTKVGSFLRKTSLDELPQIWNVFIGDMSFIGPRPDLPGALEDYTENDKKKLDVKPGITGYNQAYFRNSVSQKEKFKHDCFYVENISFLLDIKIFFRTIMSVLSRKNIY